MGDNDTPVEGNWIRQARHDQMLSLGEVAEYAGITPAYLALVETNRARPSLRALYWIAERLGRDDVARPLWPFVGIEPRTPKAADVAVQDETLF